MTKPKKSTLEEAQPETAGPIETPETSQAEQAYAQELDELRDELARTRAQAEEYLEGWQRSRAEFANYKKRIEREQAQVYQTAAGAVIKRFLSVLDDLERALKNRPQTGDGAVWAEGIELVYRKLVSILESEGVTPMEINGQMFDPNLHEAILSEDSDQHESGQIIEALQQGYLLGEKVLRPARVRVAK
jgi:molecular chaperone GrpE